MPIGYTSTSMSSVEIDEAFERALAYWEGREGSVGAAYVSSRERAERLAYLDSLTAIREVQRTNPISLQQLGILREWQKDKSLAATVYDVLGLSPGYYNLMKIVASATPEEREYWAEWYPNAHTDIKRLQEKHNRDRRQHGLGPLPFDVVCAIVAVLSPGNSWRINLLAADWLIGKRSARGNPSYPRNAQKALKMLRTWDVSTVSGPKVTVFYESLRRPHTQKDVPVLDGHMINLWRGERRMIRGIRQPSSREREQMLSDYDQAAQDVGMHVQDLQALAWYIWRFTEEESPLPPRRAIAEAQEFLKEDYRTMREAKKQGRRRAEEYLKEAEEWGEIGMVQSDDYPILLNPTKQELWRLLGAGDVPVRGLMAGDDIYLWPARQATHWHAIRRLRLPIPIEEMTVRLQLNSARDIVVTLAHGAMSTKDHLVREHPYFANRHIPFRLKEKVNLDDEIGAVPPEEIFTTPIDFDLGAELAANPETPVATLRFLLDYFYDPGRFDSVKRERAYESAVLRPLASNPSTPPDMLTLLVVHFPMEVVNNIVWPLLLLENPNALKDVATNLHSHLNYDDPYRARFFYSDAYLTMNPIVKTYRTYSYAKNVPSRIEVFADNSVLASVSSSLYYFDSLDIYEKQDWQEFSSDLAPIWLMREWGQLHESPSRKPAKPKVVKTRGRKKSK